MRDKWKPEPTQLLKDFRSVASEPAGESAELLLGEKAAMDLLQKDSVEFIQELCRLEIEYMRVQTALLRAETALLKAKTAKIRQARSSENQPLRRLTGWGRNRWWNWN